MAADLSLYEAGIHYVPAGHTVLCGPQEPQDRSHLRSRPLQAHTAAMLNPASGPQGQLGPLTPVRVSSGNWLLTHCRRPSRILATARHSAKPAASKVHALSPKLLSLNSTPTSPRSAGEKTAFHYPHNFCISKKIAQHSFEKQDDTVLIFPRFLFLSCPYCDEPHEDTGSGLTSLLSQNPRKCHGMGQSSGSL